MKCNWATHWCRAFVRICVLFGCLNGAIAQAEPSLPILSDVVVIETADFVLTDSATLPSVDAKWHKLNLPDNWNVQHPGQGGSGWYRIRLLVGEVPATLHAIYLAHASMHATVFLNGLSLDGNGDIFENGIRNWSRPTLVKFFPRNLTSGVNEILIRVDAEADQLGGLSKVEIGPASALEPKYQVRRLVLLEIPQIAEIVLALLCSMTFVFWIFLKDSIYGYFTLAAGTRFLRELDTLFVDFALPSGWEQLGVACLVFWSVVFLILFSIRLLELNWMRVEKGLLWAAIAVVAIFLLLGGHPAASRATEILHIAVLVLGGCGLIALIPQVGRISYSESVPLAITGIATFFLGVHDVFVRFGWYATDIKRLSQLGVPLLITTMAFILVSRHVRTTLALLKYSDELETKVAQKTHELAKSLSAQYQIEQRAALTAERELMLREMHDGVGNYLSIALRSLSRVAPDLQLVHRTLSDCMLDVRLMIDSLGDSESRVDNVSTVLGNLRYRIEPALKAEGIQLVWNVQEIQIAAELNSRNVLNITRIFQEEGVQDFV